MCEQPVKQLAREIGDVRDADNERAAHFAEMRETRMQAARGRGLDEGLISDMVENFYAAIRKHEVLGPIFAERVTDWPYHLANMKRFWASVLMGAGTYAGNPMVKHVKIDNIDTPEFVAWLALFSETLDGLDMPEAARQEVMARASSIAASLLNGVHTVRNGGVKI